MFEDDSETILISACLLGLRTTFRGKSNYNRRFLRLMRARKVIPVCPEQLAGLPTPRQPSEIQGGDGLDVIRGKAKVIMKDDKDVTRKFCHGARQVLKLASLVKPALVIFKERSPSCGVKFIYDGSFSNTIKKGRGVTTALLKDKGFRVISDEEFLHKTAV